MSETASEQEDVRYGARLNSFEWKCHCRGGAPWWSVHDSNVRKCRNCGLTNPATKPKRAAPDE